VLTAAFLRRMMSILHGIVGSTLGILSRRPGVVSVSTRPKHRDGPAAPKPATGALHEGSVTCDHHHHDPRISCRRCRGQQRQVRQARTSLSISCYMPTKNPGSARVVEVNLCLRIALTSEGRHISSAWRKLEASATKHRPPSTPRTTLLPATSHRQVELRQASTFLTLPSPPTQSTTIIKTA